MSDERARAARDVTPATLREIVRLACLAPSVHNTQPWLWRPVRGGVELHGDPRRRLAFADPAARNLVISCGAALHHADVAARALGWVPQVEVAAAGPSSTLLATVRLAPGAPSPTAEEDLEVLHRRHTDRRRFTSWPLTDERVAQLAARARAWDVHAAAVLDPRDRFQVDRLDARAREIQAHDGRLEAEQRRWIDHSPVDGVPRGILPARAGRAGDRNRFQVGPLLQDADVRESFEATILLFTASDDRTAWLRTGQALSDIWLAATRSGIALVPLSQACEVPAVRAELGDLVLDDLGTPQLVLKVGWEPTTHDALRRTPRRPLEDVLLD